jgi:hypothetical protein
MKEFSKILSEFKNNIVQSGDDGAAFQFNLGNGVMWVVASFAGDWDHVSVSLSLDRCPNWNEMCGIKDMFFEPDEAVIQIHPPKSEYVNKHPYCLHLWKPQKENIPLPPKSFV